MELLSYQEFINEGKREDYIKKYCNPSSLEPPKPIEFKSLYKILKSLKKYKETLKAIDRGDAAIVGIRRSLEKRKTNPEKYVDGIYFIPKGAKKTNPNIIPFESTTVPSVAWYNHEVAILDDIEYRFKIGTHSFGGGKTIPALVPYNPGLGFKEINVRRFSTKDDEVKTYDPEKKDIGTATNFHYGLDPKGKEDENKITCVGAYSAGCQVIATEKKWNEFWDMVKRSGQDIFWYSIIEEDKIKS